MAPKTPYLKLHTEEPTRATGGEQFRGLHEITESLTESTGWRFRFQVSQDDAQEQDKTGWDAPCAGRIVVDPAPDANTSQHITTHRNAERIAESLSAVLDELTQTRHAVWQREAELAAGVPVTMRQDESSHLAARLESSLIAGASAIGCDAAAIYILDDATTKLKLRSSWGLPSDRLVAPPRDLRGEMADLEALMGHAVVIEDCQEPLPWKSPEAGFGAALCVPISTPSTPLGTMWLFSESARPFSEGDTSIAEIVGGRIAAELEREMMLTQSAAARTVERQIDMAGDWFTQRLPQITPLTPQWQFAGARLDDSPSGEFYDWSVQSDGRLSCAVADCPGFNINALLNSAALRAAFQSHQSHRHSATSLLRRLNDTLWSSSPGDTMASMFYALIDEDTGVMEYAAAGDPLVIALRDSKFRGLVSGGLPLGIDPDLTIDGRKRRIARDETLILLTESARHISMSDGQSLDEATLARAVREWRNLDAKPLCERITSWLHEQADAAAPPKACVMVLKRRQDKAT